MRNVVKPSFIEWMYLLQAAGFEVACNRLRSLMPCEPGDLLVRCEPVSLALSADNIQIIVSTMGSKYKVHAVYSPLDGVAFVAIITDLNGPKFLTPNDVPEDDLQRVARDKGDAWRSADGSLHASVSKELAARLTLMAMVECDALKTVADLLCGPEGTT